MGMFRYVFKTGSTRINKSKCSKKRYAPLYFDLTETNRALNEARHKLGEVCGTPNIKNTLLLIGTSPASKGPILSQAKLAPTKIFTVTGRWKGGTISNWRYHQTRRKA